MKKLTNRIMIVVFVAFLSLSFFMPMVVADQEFSDLENRFLSQLPSFSIKELFNGDFTEEFEDYVEDQFPLREQWITLKNEIELLLGKQEVNGVYFGKDDYYFEVKKEYDEELFLKNINFVNQFGAYLKENNINTYFFPIFSSYTYYPEKLPSNAPFVDELAMLKILKENLDIDVIESFDLLYSHRDENLYFKSDHHWNQLGAYYAYVAICEKLGVDAIPLSVYDKSCASENFMGTLFSKAPVFNYVGDEFCYYQDTQHSFEVYIRDDEETFDYLYFTENLSQKDKYVTFLSGNHGEVHIKSNANTGRTLVMLKDSYSHALAPLLASHFDEIVLLDLRYYKAPIKQFIEEFKPTDVMYSYHMMWFAEDKNMFMLR